ncbi:Tetratricopeptide repeat family protein [Indibacter alkaliphilus LW1]|uniref:Tetratricopeptide repeat family protein n=2 Tax=Indibacter TaxID=647744 RepID=S2DHW5_INDAL|nr:tetratricopeptide repeat protein [Indibacter alkaliphilus]EOZ96775.1 Tetratricopeptide repeat family protein [Indibacter alkaliphilus LW1]
MKNKLLWLFAITILLACSPSEEELFDEGIKMLESGEYQKSIEFMDRVIDKNPEHTSAYNAKGVAFYQQEKYDEAIEAFSASIDLDETSYKPFFNRGNAHLEKKQFKEAVLDYNKANGLDPQQSDIYYNRGLALLGMEEYEDAIFDFDVILQANPNQPLVQFNKAKAQLGNNDPVAAIESLVNTVNMDNSNGPAYYLLGVTQMSAFGQKEDGCANLKMALSLGFSEAKVWIDDFCKD